MADITYKKLSPRDKILKRPGQVMGSIKTVKKTVWIAEKDGEEYKIIEKEIPYNNGYIHCFMEVLSNAQNNYYESLDGETPSKIIKVEYNPQTHSISVWNDGNAIPIRKHEWQEDEDASMKNVTLYEHELIFGHLDSSSNFDDDKKDRKGGGLHGLGAKLVNIFADEFIAEGHANGQKIIVKWTNNMGEQSVPKITSLKNGKDYTKITYTLDFKRFGGTGYDEEIISVMKKMCIDCATCTGLKVYFTISGSLPEVTELLKPKNFMEYVSMYALANKEKLEFKSNDSTLIICEKSEYEPELKQISFVNGIYTSNGGVHVKAWLDLILPPLLEKLRKKFKNVKLTNKNLYSYFIFFLKCDLINPNFDGNTKTILESPAPDTTLTNGKLETKIDKMAKWEFVNDIELSDQNKLNKKAKKTDGTKSKNVYIANAVPCKFAGTAKSAECTCILVEGLSAKAMAVKAIATLPNKDYYAIIPVRGKLLNVRTANDTTISKNIEFANLKQMVGLKEKVKYNETNIKTLRFGSVELWTDADPDGSHIKGLGINIFDVFWPELLDMGFVCIKQFPLGRVKWKGQIYDFLYMKDLNEFIKDKPNAIVNYYKGLGGYPDEELADIIKNAKTLVLKRTEKCIDKIDMLFNGKRAADKKVWLETPVKDEIETEQLPITDFCDSEFKIYSFYANERCIPSVIDGLKPAQRKAAWVGLHSLSKTTDYKVSQFASTIALNTQYHHAVASMEETVVGMSQTFIGSNNITLFEGRGQFGTIIEGGADAASSRYISVRQSNVARYLFRKEDDDILEYVMEDGISIEPKYFIPVIPYILCNGTDGIGWGHSSHMLFYNPTDLIQQVKNLISGQELETLPALKPWYWNFKGSFIEENGKLYCYGAFKVVDEAVVYVDALPVGEWSCNYKSFLQKLKEDKLIAKWEGGDNPFEIDFKIYLSSTSTFEPGYETLKLKKPLSTNNMSAFTPEGTLKQYKDINEIINVFYKVRYEAYEKRKKHMLSVYDTQIKMLESKLKYTNLIRSDASILLQDEEDLFAYLEKEGYYSWQGAKEKGFQYLTDIRNGNFTNNNLVKLEKELENAKNNKEELKKTSIKKIWLSELDELEVEYEKWKTNILKIREKLTCKTVTKGKKKKV